MSGNHATPAQEKLSTTAQPFEKVAGFALPIARLIKRKVWLPRTLYTLIPLFYLISGAIALASAIWLPGWSWILPYALLGAGICLHAAIAISLMRLKSSKK